MLGIHAGQEALLSVARDGALRAAIYEHLRVRRPELIADAPAAGWAARLAAVVAAGRALGLREARSYSLLAALMLRLGPGIATAPEVVRALGDAPDPDAGLRRLPVTLSATEWDRLARVARASAWPSETHARGPAR